MRQIIWFLLLIVSASPAWAADCRPAVDQLSAASSALDTHHDAMVASRVDWASLKITEDNRPIYVAFADTTGLTMRAMDSHVAAMRRAMPLMTMCHLKVITEFDDAQMAILSASLMAARIAERETLAYLAAFSNLP